MLSGHNHIIPKIQDSSYIAPNAFICGDVTIGKNCRIMHGAQLIAENNPIIIGDNCIVLQNAVLRAAAYSKLMVSDNCLIGPNTHLVSCTLESDVFIATGVSVFHGAKLGSGSEVRINGVVHLKTELLPNSMVPINWVAVGKPAQLFSADRNEEIWAIQKDLAFDATVYGIKESEFQNSRMFKICHQMSKRLKIHQEDEILDLNFKS